MIKEKEAGSTLEPSIKSFQYEALSRPDEFRRFLHSSNTAPLSFSKSSSDARIYKITDPIRLHVALNTSRPSWRSFTKIL